MLPAPPALPVTHVNLGPEGGRELAVLLGQPHLTEPQPSQSLEQQSGSQGAASQPSVPCWGRQHQLATSLCWLCPALTHPGNAEPSLLTCRTTAGPQRVAVTSQDHQFSSASCRCGGDRWLALEHECRRLKKT